MTGDPDNEGYIIEFVPVGNAVKVSAMDPRTLTEVSIVGPVSASKMDLQQTVIRKLHYVLERQSGRTSDDKPSDPSGRGGIIV